MLAWRIIGAYLVVLALTQLGGYVPQSGVIQAVLLLIAGGMFLLGM